MPKVGCPGCNNYTDGVCIARVKVRPKGANLIEGDDELIKAISDSDTFRRIVEKIAHSGNKEAFINIFDMLPENLTRERVIEILQAITRTSDGRRDTAAILSSRLADRLSDVNYAIRAFVAMLENSKTIETDMQEFIQDHPWLIGLEYVKVRPKQKVLRGALDFLLERYDGYHDMLELKSPDDPIIIEKDSEDKSMPAPPSQYSLSPSLANALAQSHSYRDTMTKYENAIEEQFGIRNPAQPNIYIIIGKASKLTDIQRRILRQLNLSMHRVQIVPYDILSYRAGQLIENIQKYLKNEYSSPEEARLTDD